MGTNYYWRHNACTCCGRYDELHVGKSSAGFHGHFDADGAPLITEWSDWKSVLRGEDPGYGEGELWDEYGDRVDVEEFIAGRESTTPEFRARQYQWMVEHQGQIGVDPSRLGRVAPGCDWLDADGWSFTGGDFS